ncbi:MAG: M81 family metallopeptidase [Defluviitaleaceae bacterium]|nr:M81 family metallopeptidase [Defluviitaleaceae bacterium]
MRIFTTGISQESNSFNPLKSTYDDFVIYSGKEFRDTPGVAAIIEEGFDVAESIYARAVPGGTLRFDDFMRLVDEMLSPLMDGGAFDGVFLPMHGALDVEYIGSGETYVVSRVREIVGPEVPISVALDMHANNTYTLIGLCNIMYGYRTAPHIDVAETHVRAAKLLIRALREGVMPHTEIIRIPYIMPGENMMTESGMGKQIIDFLPSIESEPGVWCASYFVGMTWVDCPQNGAAVLVTGVGDLSGGMERARELAQFVWDNRGDFKYQGTALEPEAAVEFVKSHKSGGLVILSDSADNVTAGAAGDNALMLNMFLRHKISGVLIAAITDPRAVEECSRHGAGSRIDIVIGSAFDKDSETCTIQGATIKKLTLDLPGDKPASAVLSCNGIDILLFSKRKPVPDEDVLSEHGLSLRDYNILVVKQGYLTPRLKEAAKHEVLALTPGNCYQLVERINFKKMRRPMYPLDAAECIDPKRLFEQI